MNGFIGKEERGALKKLHRKIKGKRYPDRIKCILLLDAGWTYQQIKEVLLIEEPTISEWQKIYQQGGIDKLLECNYKGYEGKLTDKQEKTLKEHLKESMARSAKEVIEYVKKIFNVSYTKEGMVHTLHRLGFVYKRTKPIPGKQDIEQQQKFIEEYEELKETKGEDEKIYFMDAVHPQHNSMTAYGWIEKGKEKKILTNTGRKRLNINGALDAEQGEVIEREDERINATSTIRLFEEIERRNSNAKKIYIIADNARYNRAKEIGEYLKNSKIEIKFLPPYSPNLNKMEQIWKLFKSKVIRGKYYERFEEFRASVHYFFANIEQYREETDNILKAKFHLIYMDIPRTPT